MWRRLVSFSTKKEVLFDLGTLFKVETVNNDDDLWEVCLSATADGQKIARKYFEETKK